MSREILREAGKGRTAMERVLQLLEGPLTACIAGGRSTCWQFATHVSVYRRGVVTPQGEVR